MECMVCSRPVLSSTSKSRKCILSPEILEDQLVVVYFFQKFFEVPLLVENGEGCDATDESTTLEALLSSLGNPVNWANFCGSCCTMIRRAKGLQRQLVKIEEQLRKVRSKITAKIMKQRSEAEESLEVWTRKYLGARIRENSNKLESGDTSLETAFVKTNLTDAEQFVTVKLEPIEMEPDDYFLVSSVESPLDLKMEADFSDSLNVDDYIISPEDKDISKLDKRPNRQLSQQTRLDGKMLKKRLKERVDQDEYTTCNNNEKDLKNKDDASEENSERSSESEDNIDETDDEDYVPEPELSERKLSNRVKPGRKPGKEQGHSRVYRRKKGAQDFGPESERTCSICHEVFTRQQLLKNHMNSKHIKQVLFTCNVCQKEFYTRGAYTLHSKMHLTSEEIKHLILANKLDAVKIDGPLLPNDEPLNMLDGETGEKYSAEVLNQIMSRTCEFCKKLFASASQKRGHVQDIHFKTKPYVCEKCGKSFGKQSALTRHATSHTSERTFNCEDPNCIILFKSRGNARKHFKLVHLKKFMTLCPHCGKRFTENNTLQRHIFTVHTENAPRNFKCHICPKTFLTKTLLTLHLKCRSHGGPGLKKRKWIPKHIRLQMKIDQGLISPSLETKSQSTSDVVFEPSTDMNL